MALGGSTLGLFSRLLCSSTEPQRSLIQNKEKKRTKIIGTAVKFQIRMYTCTCLCAEHIQCNFFDHNKHVAVLDHSYMLRLNGTNPTPTVKFRNQI